MILFYFLVNAFSLSWLAFDTEMKLISACNICQKVVDIMIYNFSYLRKPLINSTCSKNFNNNSNIYCTLIKEIHEDIVSRYEEDIPPDYCSLHGPCIFDTPPDLMGQNCAPCLSIITFTFEAEKDKRESTLEKYCASTIGSVIPFCNGIKYIISKSMKNQFLQYHSAVDFCINAAFCQHNIENYEYSDL